MNEWKNWLKSHYQFDLFQNKRDSYAYGSPFQVNKREDISYSYNYNMDKRNFFDTLWNIPIHNYLVEDDILNVMGKFSHRKFFNWWILHFCFRNKANIGSGVDTSTKNQENNTSNQKIFLFDWMRMNEEMLSRPISNMELWFSKFMLLYNAHKDPLIALNELIASNEKIAPNEKKID
ncbi:hypothetical protein GQ457_18G012460 [Hibiscus cannabinus]